MRQPRSLVPALLVALALAGCAPGSPPGGAGAAPPVGNGDGAAPAAAAPPRTGQGPGPKAGAPAAPGIEWFAGSPEEGFARARREDRPVFLYWSASWCPPCHELKAHVFSRPEVIERARAFVAIAVDGDEAGAQKLGERFGVLGYPTAVVLRPDGTEVTRVGGGMDLEAYADALDVGLADRRPVSALLAELGAPAARAASAPLALEDCRRLAFHGWDAEPLSAPLGRARAFDAAIERCPPAATLERARLEVLAGQALAAAERDALRGGAAPSSRLAAHLARLQALLRDAALASRTVDLLRAPDDGLFLAAPRTAGVDATRLRDDWVALLMAAARDPRVTPGAQLSSAGAALRVHKGFTEGALPPALADESRRLATALLAAHPDGYAHSGVVNGASRVYHELGDRRAARALLAREVRTSRSPHYYLSDLADLAEAEGDATAALRYFERAYDAVQGPASRFQWGVLYAQGLLRMAPQDASRIERVTLAVLGELDGPDRLYTRSRVRLAQLDAGLRSWADARPEAAPVLAKLRARMLPVCGRYAAGDPAREACDRFLAPAAAAATGVSRRT